jgi:hypothetical protein
MDRLTYEGYVIEATPHQLADDGRWTLNFNIERHEDDHTKVRPFSASNTFETRAEALRHCLNFGRQIIDGQVVSCVAP